MNLKEFKKELLNNPEFKKEYEKYDLAFEVGQMLAEARIIKGITQENLAKMINTKQSGVARAERGTTLPSLSFLEKIAKALKTNLIVRFSFMEESIISLRENNSGVKKTEFVNRDGVQPSPLSIVYSYHANERSNYA